MKLVAFVLTLVLTWPCLLVAQPPPVVIGSGGAGGVLRNSQGWLYAVYTDTFWRIICKASTDNGQTWPISYVLNQIGTNIQGMAPALAIAKGDTLYAAWRQDYFDSLGRWGQDIFWSRFDGSSWTPMAHVANQLAAYAPSLVVDPSNHPHVVWNYYGNSLECYYYSWFDGASWSPPEFVANGFWGASLGVDSSGDLHLTCESGRNWTYRKRVGGVWGTPTVIDSGYEGCLALDRLGRPHTVWIQPQKSQYEILYSFNNDTIWAPSLNLSNNRGASYYNTISCDLRNNLYVAWQDNSMDTTKSDRIFYRTYDGSSWSPITVVSTDTVYPSDSPSIGYPVTDSGVDVVWTNGYNVVYRRLPLVGVGVEDQNQKAFNIEGIKLNVSSPARRELRVSYSLPSQSKVSLVLYDLSGRKVMVLDEGEKPTGRYEVRRSLGLPAGVYFLRLETGSVALTRKIVVLR